MADYSKNGVQGLINALELVAPAVDPADPIAKEQLQSAVRYLQFLRARLDHVYDRERFELRHYLDMTDRLIASRQVHGGITASLADFNSRGQELFSRVGANVPEMRACTAAIAAAVTALVKEMASAESSSRSEVERIILEATRDRILFERAWYLPLGFDHSPGEVPSIEVVIAHQRKAEASSSAGSPSHPPVGTRP